MHDWIYKGKIWEPTKEELESWCGFVYIITNKITGKKYIGKRGLWSRRKLPPLKGNKRKRIKIVESDWQKYYGSSEEVKALVEHHGKDNFHREILILCKSKGEMSYLEAYCQMKLNVLLQPDDYYNAFIGLKCHRKHVSKLTPERMRAIDTLLTIKV